MKTCVLIQTCDKYEHLWEGLKLSYEKNWCWDINLPIFILTEDKIFPYARFTTINPGFFGQESNPAKNFSTRLIFAMNHLKNIGYEYVFYTQDDFWPIINVDINIIKESLNYLINNNIDCLHVTEYLPYCDYVLYDTEESVLGITLKKYENLSPFYYNHQSSFWKINSLLSIQSDYEDPYENECRGTERCWEKRLKNYLLDYSWYKAELINNKGKLLQTAQDLIDNWNLAKKIDIDMNNRLDKIVNFEFFPPDNVDFEGYLKATLSSDAGTYFDKNELPLRFQVYNNNNYVVWSTDLFPGVWSVYAYITFCKADIITSTGVKLLEWNWNVFEHGDFCHQAFYLWSLKNKGCKGIAIGTHDGTSGEWVGPVGEGILPAVLVEPSDRQFYLLERLYANKSWITLDKSCVSINGGQIKFYEAGLGHTNSTNPENLKKYLPGVDVVEKVYQSLTLRQILDKHGIGNGVWWMHLDVEDLDDKLILSFDHENINLPDCLIFENETLDEQRLVSISNWLQSHSYQCTSSGRNTICFLKK